MSENENHLSYSPANILYVLGMVERAYNESKLSFGSLAHAVDSIGFSRGNWDNILKDKKKYSEGKKQIPEAVFNKIVNYLVEINALSNKNINEKNHRNVTEIEDYLHYAVSSFLNISSETETSQIELEGYYIMYKPSSIGGLDNANDQQGFAKTIICLEAMQTGAIRFKEIIHYAMSEKEQKKKNQVTGYLWQAGENVLLIGMDDDTKFTRLLILKRARGSKNRLEDLKGACLMVDGSTPFAFPVYLERANIRSPSHLKSVVKELDVIEQKDVPISARNHLKTKIVDGIAYFNINKGL